MQGMCSARGKDTNMGCYSNPKAPSSCQRDQGKGTNPYLAPTVCQAPWCMLDRDGAPQSQKESGSEVRLPTA